MVEIKHYGDVSAMNDNEFNAFEHMRFSLKKDENTFNRQLGISLPSYSYNQHLDIAKYDCNYHALMLYVQSAPIAIAYWQDNLPSNLVIIYGLYVKEKYRNKGYGSMIFEETLKDIDSQYPGSVVSLNVYSKNKAALNLYSKYGFNEKMYIGLVKNK